MTQDGKADSIGHEKSRTISELKEDMAYLVDEINALGDFIGYIPFSERPGEDVSILDMILEINRMQNRYYKVMVSECPDEDDTLGDIKEEGKEADILENVIKNRQSFVQRAGKLPDTQWESTIILNGSKTTLLKVMSEMIEDERFILKKISERIMTIKNLSMP